MQRAYYRPIGQVFLLIFWTLSLIAAGLLLYTARQIVIAALVGVGAGVLITPAIDIMKEKFRIPRGVGAVLLLISGTSVVALFSYILAGLVSQQFQSLITRAPTIFSTLKAKVETLAATEHWILDQINKFDFGSSAQTALGTLFQGVQLGVTFVVFMVLVTVIAIYLAINSNSYFRGLILLFPAYLRPRATEVFVGIAGALRRWFKGQLLVMSSVGVIMTTAFWVIGIEYWLLFGLLTALLDIIPYVGPIAALVLTSIVTLGTQSDKIFWVVGSFLLIQQIEGHILVPVIMRERVQLPETPLIILMLILGQWFGILGLLVAPSLLAITRTILVMIYIPKMNQKNRSARARKRWSDRSKKKSGVNVIYGSSLRYDSRIGKTMWELTAQELQHYSRHILIKKFGVENQKKLKAARVLCVGAGGLGSSAALYLGAAGVGTLGIVDNDQVECSNLQRQIIHGYSTIGHAKAESARERIHDLNPWVEVKCYSERLTATNSKQILFYYDIIIDGSDNFPTRYLINDYCVLEKKIHIYGSVFQFTGSATVFRSDRGVGGGGAGGPCYRCLYPEPPKADLVSPCQEAGVLGVLPGMIGMIQATEAIKLITGMGDPLIGRLLHYDALAMHFREFLIEKNPLCKICGLKPEIFDLVDYDESLCYQMSKGDLNKPVEERISPKELDLRLKSDRPPLLLDVREPSEYEIANLKAKLIPLGEILNRLDEIPNDREIVVYCHHGIRSRHCIGMLRSAGFTNTLLNLEGGIDRWSREVDTSVPRY